MHHKPKAMRPLERTAARSSYQRDISQVSLDGHGSVAGNDRVFSTLGERP